MKVDNSKLTKENTKLSTEIAKLSQNNEDVQTQNEAMIKNLKEDCLKLARENAELKYGHGSKVQQGLQWPQGLPPHWSQPQPPYRMQHQRPVMMPQGHMLQSANGQPLRILRPGQQIRFVTQDHPGPWGPYHARPPC